MYHIQRTSIRDKNTYFLSSIQTNPESKLWEVAIIYYTPNFTWKYPEI